MAQDSTECANRWARIIQYNEATARAAFTGQTRWLTRQYSIVISCESLRVSPSAWHPAHGPLFQNLESGGSHHWVHPVCRGYG